MKIAILDDDPVLLDIVYGVLDREGYECSRFTSGRQLIRALHDQSFDLFILDWNVPDMSGVSVLEWIRNRIGASPPALLLTSRSADEDVIMALNAGADDFVTKPVHAPVFLARVRAVTRRLQAAKPENDVETYGAYEFDIKKRQIRRNGELQELTPREFQITLLLFRNVNIAVSRTYILETIWGLSSVSGTRTLDIHISKIRRKLELNAENGYVISPIYGHGYRLEEVTAS